MVTVTRAVFGNLIGKLRIKLLHVAAVFGDQHRAADLVADLIAVAGHFRALGKHLRGDVEGIQHNGCRPFLLGQLDPGFPSDLRHLAGNPLGEFQGFRLPVFHP